MGIALAHLIRRELSRAWGSLDMTVEEGLRQLQTLCSTEIKVEAGGIEPGITVGETDELGHNVAEDAVDVHDPHATILYLMGLEHTKLTYRFQGCDFRLTDVSGNVVKKLVA